MRLLLGWGLVGLMSFGLVGCAAGCGRVDASESAVVADMPLGTPAVRRASYGRRLEPSANVVLHGAGQSDAATYAAYTAAMGPDERPMLWMSYVDLRDDLPGFFARLKREMAEAPDFVVPQIGLSLNAGGAKTHYEAEVASGARDEELRQLVAGLQSLGRPVFLRVGYEFNGAWNGYEAAAYVGAFRRIAHEVRAAGLEQVAMVWDWSADAELDAEHGGAAAAGAGARWSAFYPGDDAVDWWALNLFSEESLRSVATQGFLSAAERRRFPVMIAESSPTHQPVAEGQRAVEGWFAPYFALVRRNPGIRAFCYIDWDWGRFPQWADWGDARVETNAQVLAFYRRQVAAPLYANARSAEATAELLHAR